MSLKYKKHKQNCIRDDQIAKASDDKEKILNSSCRKHRFVTDRELKGKRTIFLVEQDEQEDRRATSLKNTRKGGNLKFYT